MDGTYRIVIAEDRTKAVIQFMNKLWDEVRGVYPDLYIMMFAYQDSTTSPRSGLKPKGNVIVRLAYMDHEFTESRKVKRDVMFPLSHPNNRAYEEALEQWHDRSPRLAIWDYWKTYRCGFQTPIHNSAAIPGLVRKYRDIGAKHVFVEMELGTTVPLTLFVKNLDGGALVADPDAFGGKAESRDSNGKADYHARPFTFGIYEWKFGKFIANAQRAKADVPQEEKYHRYYAGRTWIYSGS